MLLAHEQFEPVGHGLEFPRVAMLGEWKEVDLVEIIKTPAPEAIKEPFDEKAAKQSFGEWCRDRGQFP